MAHQSRLALDDAEFDLAQRWANYRVLSKPYVSATALAAFASCRAKPFLQRILNAAGLSTTTWAMMQGIRAHEEVQGALAATASATELSVEDALAARSFAFANEYKLHDPRRNLRGIADIVFVSDGEAHIVELKNIRPPTTPDPVWGAPVWFEHGLQVHVYGLMLAAEWNVRPILHVAYLLGDAKRAFLDSMSATSDAHAALTRLTAAHSPLASTRDTDRFLSDLIREMRRVERQSLLPMPGHDDATKCAACPVRAWCPRRLDRPGEFAQVPLAALGNDA